MTIKIVTDSTADLPDKLVNDLKVAVVPVYVRFGNEVYRDRVDITEDQFYRRLTTDPVHPSTAQPSPQDFTDVYNKLAEEAEGIVSIHVTSKLSGTYSSALRAKEQVNKKCPIEVIDSEVVTMGLGQLVILACAGARAGKSLSQIVREVKQNIANIHLLGLLDTLKYLAAGGRIGKLQAYLSSILNIKPLLTIKYGTLAPAGRVRSRSKGIEMLYDFVKNATNIQDLSVIYNTTFDEARALVKQLGSVFPAEKIILSRLGPALGVHAGPGILFVSMRHSR
jgi:DegV family protein with EDD domain